MNDRIMVLIIFGFEASLFIANFVYYGAEAAGYSMSISLFTGPIGYGIYKLVKYAYKKSKTIKAAV